MLSIRMQRTGRKGHAMFRLVVQESRFTPTSGNLVAQIGSYDPHTKAAIVNVEKAGFYLKNGAQPSGRAAALLQKEGVEMPQWVKFAAEKNRTTRNPEKLRRNQPAEDKAAEPETVAEPESPAAATEAAEASEAAAAPEAETGTTEA